MLPALLVAALLVPWAARAQDNVELAFMPETKTVTLLNEGGKYVAIDLKHIPEGSNCRIDRSAGSLQSQGSRRVAEGRRD